MTGKELWEEKNEYMWKMGDLANECEGLKTDIAAKDAEIKEMKSALYLAEALCVNGALEISKLKNGIADLRQLAREALEARNDETVGDIIGPEDLRWMEEGCWCEMNAYRTLRRIAGEGE